MVRITFQPANGASGRIDMVATNSSGKSITALKVRLKMLSSTGSMTTSHLSVDLLSTYAGVSRAPRITNRYQHFGPLGNGEQLFRQVGAIGSHIVADVTGIVFDDNTIAGDRVWAQTVFDHHAAASVELSNAINTLNEVPSTDLRNRIATSRQQLSERWQARPKLAAQTEGSVSGVAFARSFILTKLSEVSRDSISDDEVGRQFKDALAYFADTAADMQKHSILVEVGK